MKRWINVKIMILIMCSIMMSCENDDMNESGNEEGQVTFWIKSDLQVGSITVLINNEYVGEITSFFSTGMPSCGLTGCATASLIPETYSYTASATNGISWAGTITITSGQCLKQELSAPITGENGGGSGKNSTHTEITTNFVVNTDLSTLDGLGNWWMQGFTIDSPQKFVIRFASTYQADCAVITASQIDNFKNNRSFTGYALFDNQIGFKYVTLNAGSYYVAIRNQVSTQNTMRVELDYDISLPASDNCSYFDNYIQNSKIYSAGQRMWHHFSIQDGFRYYLDGCNSGIDLYIIPASELTKFQNGQIFQYYTDYKPAGIDGPGLWEILLPFGEYYLVGTNNTSVSQSVVYNMERWKQN